MVKANHVEALFLFVVFSSTPTVAVLQAVHNLRSVRLSQVGCLEDLTRFPTEK